VQDTHAELGDGFLRTMNIAQVVRSLELGGLERVTVDLAAVQKKTGNSVTIYSVYKHDPSLVNAAKRAGLSVFQLNKMTGFSVRTLLKMVRQFRRDRVTVVHTHNELVHTYGTIAGRIAGVPCIINTIHGTKGGKDQRLDRNYRALLPWTDAVVTVSSETGDQFADERLRHPRKFHVIRNGIPVDRFMAFSARPGSHWPRIRFGTVARLVDVKDQATLIRAFQKVQNTNPHAELHLLGDGPLRTKLETLSKQLEVDQSVIFHGAGDNVPEFLSELDVFVLSSLSEGLPISILEAMSAGLPIVSTRVGGICEIAVEHTVAAYCEPGDPEALAHTMESVLDLERMRLMGQAGQAIAKQSFTIEAMSKNYEALYRTVLSKKYLYFKSLTPF
jgi:glycosyltransferase involved in cell wall biosynthesis